MTYYPGLFGDRRRRERFWPLLVVSLVLHAGLFLLFSRFHIRPADRSLDAPIQMVELGTGSGGARGRGLAVQGPKASEPPNPPPVDKAPEAPPPAAVRVPEPKPQPETKPPVTARVPEPKPKPEPEAKAPPPPKPEPDAKPIPKSAALPRRAPPPRTAPERRPSPPERTEADVAKRIERMRERHAGSDEDQVAQRVAQLRQKQAGAGGEVSEKVAQLRQRLLQGSEEQVEQHVAALRAKYGTREPGQGASPTGTGEGGALGVSGGGGPGLQGFLESQYVQRVRGHLNQFWSVPETLKGRGHEAFVTVIVDRRGKIVNWGVRKSGNRLFDEKVERAVAEADPLPPVPSGMVGERFEFELRFSAP